MAGEGFDTGAGAPGASDPGRAARDAADRIAQQVRNILQNAEETATGIRGRAEHEADAIRENAAGAAARMLERVDELEGQMNSFLGEFFETIRGELRGLAPAEQIEAAAAQAAQPAHTEEIAAPEPEPEPQTQGEVRPFPEPQQEEAEEPRRRRGLLWGRRERSEGDAEPAIAEESEDPEDAHVMALNMALNGTPREETESYLVRRFGGLEDLESILDDVYGRVKRR